MERALIWAGAALQIVCFQLLLWAAQAGNRPRVLGLGATVVAIALGMLLLYRRNVSPR